MQRLTNNILFNLAVLTFGAAVYSFGIKDIVVAKGLMSGGVSGVALLLFYLTGALGPGVYYFLLNLPLMVLGWVSLSRRFILYTVYGMGILSLFMQLMPERELIADPILAAVFGGDAMAPGSASTRPATCRPSRSPRTASRKCSTTSSARPPPASSAWKT